MQDGVLIHKGAGGFEVTEWKPARGEDAVDIGSLHVTCLISRAQKLCSAPGFAYAFPLLRPLFSLTLWLSISFTRFQCLCDDIPLILQVWLGFVCSRCSCNLTHASSSPCFAVVCPVRANTQGGGNFVFFSMVSSAQCLAHSGTQQIFLNQSVNECSRSQRKRICSPTFPFPSLYRMLPLL